MSHILAHAGTHTLAHQTDHAVVLIGHGSLRSASGASMIRIATRLRQRGVAPVVEAAFLNYSRPTLAETVAKIAAEGVTSITVQPYFLIAGAYVQNDLAALIAEVNNQFPSIRFQLAPVLGDHHALVSLAQRRAQAGLETLPYAASPTPGSRDKCQEFACTALLLMAHGTPLPAANAPLYTIADTVASRLRLVYARVGFLDCNTPTIADAFDELVQSGAQQIIALPYFLHLGRHVAEDLPRLVADAQARHRAIPMSLAHHLDYDQGLVDAIEERLRTAEPFIALLASPLTSPLNSAAAQPAALPV